MPSVDHNYDHRVLHQLDIDPDKYKHAHYVGWYQPPDHVELGHGNPATKIQNQRGDWYAYHTH